MYNFYVCTCKVAADKKTLIWINCGLFLFSLCLLVSAVFEIALSLSFSLLSLIISLSVSFPFVYYLNGCRFHVNFHSFRALREIDALNYDPDAARREKSRKRISVSKMSSNPPRYKNSSQLRVRVVSKAETLHAVRVSEMQEQIKAKDTAALLHNSIGILKQEIQELHRELEHIEIAIIKNEEPVPLKKTSRVVQTANLMQLQKQSDQLKQDIEHYKMLIKPKSLEDLRNENEEVKIRIKLLLRQLETLDAEIEVSKKQKEAIKITANYDDVQSQKKKIKKLKKKIAESKVKHHELKEKYEHVQNGLSKVNSLFNVDESPEIRSLKMRLQLARHNLGAATEKYVQLKSKQIEEIKEVKASQDEIIEFYEEEEEEEDIPQSAEEEQQEDISQMKIRSVLIEHEEKIDSQLMKMLFGKFGKIESFQLSEDEYHAFVVYEDFSSACSAVTNINEVELNGSLLHVSLFDRKKSQKFNKLAKEKEKPPQVEIAFNIDDTIDITHKMMEGHEEDANERSKPPEEEQNDFEDFEEEPEDKINPVLSVAESLVKSFDEDSKDETTEINTSYNNAEPASDECEKSEEDLSKSPIAAKKPVSLNVENSFTLEIIDFGKEEDKDFVITKKDKPEHKEIIPVKQDDVQFDSENIVFNSSTPEHKKVSKSYNEQIIKDDDEVLRSKDDSNIRPRNLLGIFGKSVQETISAKEVPIKTENEDVEIKNSSSHDKLEITIEKNDDKNSSHEFNGEALNQEIDKNSNNIQTNDSKIEDQDEIIDIKVVDEPVEPVMTSIDVTNPPTIDDKTEIIIDDKKDETPQLFDAFQRSIETLIDDTNEKKSSSEKEEEPLSAQKEIEIDEPKENVDDLIEKENENEAEKSDNNEVELIEVVSEPEHKEQEEIVEEIISKASDNEKKDDIIIDEQIKENEDLSSPEKLKEEVQPVIAETKPIEEENEQETSIKKDIGETPEVITFNTDEVKKESDVQPTNEEHEQESNQEEKHQHDNSDVEDKKSDNSSEHVTVHEESKQESDKLPDEIKQETNEINVVDKATTNDELPTVENDPVINEQEKFGETPKVIQEEIIKEITEEATDILPEETQESIEKQATEEAKEVLLNNAIEAVDKCDEPKTQDEEDKDEKPQNEEVEPCKEPVSLIGFLQNAVIDALEEEENVVKSREIEKPEEQVVSFSSARGEEVIDGMVVDDNDNHSPVVSTEEIIAINQEEIDIRAENDQEVTQTEVQQIETQVEDVPNDTKEENQVEITKEEEKKDEIEIISIELSSSDDKEKEKKSSSSSSSIIEDVIEVVEPEEKHLSSSSHKANEEQPTAAQNTGSKKSDKENEKDSSQTQEKEDLPILTHDSNHSSANLVEEISPKMEEKQIEPEFKQSSEHSKEETIARELPSDEPKAAEEVLNESSSHKQDQSHIEEENKLSSSSSQKPTHSASSKPNEDEEKLNSSSSHKSKHSSTPQKETEEIIIKSSSSSNIKDKEASSSSHIKQESEKVEEELKEEHPSPRPQRDEEPKSNHSSAKPQKDEETKALSSASQKSKNSSSKPQNEEEIKKELSSSHLSSHSSSKQKKEEETKHSFSNLQSEEHSSACKSNHSSSKPQKEEEMKALSSASQKSRHSSSKPQEKMINSSSQLKEQIALLSSSSTGDEEIKPEALLVGHLTSSSSSIKIETGNAIDALYQVLNEPKEESEKKQEEIEKPKDIGSSGMMVEDHISSSRKTHHKHSSNSAKKESEAVSNSSKHSTSSRHKHKHVHKHRRSSSIKQNTTIPEFESTSDSPSIPKPSLPSAHLSEHDSGELADESIVADI